MTSEKQRYSGYVKRGRETALYSHAIVSLAMIGSALILLESLV